MRIIGVIIGALIGVAIWRFFVWVASKSEKQEYTLVERYEPFSVSDYLTRIENTALDIQRKREQEKPHVIVLWLLLDGLRINGDGTFEWIRREEKKSDPLVNYAGGYGGDGGACCAYPLWNCYQPYYSPLYPAQNYSPLISNAPMSMQMQLLNTQLALSNSIQTQILLDSCNAITMT